MPIDDSRPLEPGEDARVTAALDQLLAALSDISGTELTSPIIVLARVDESDGLCLFHADVSPDEVPLLLTTAAITTLQGRPDIQWAEEDDPE